MTLRTPFFQARTLNQAGKLNGSSAVSGTSAFVIALFSALLFVVHPLQTQAVTYVVQRYTSLATLFYLLSIFMYAKWRAASAGSETAVSKTELAPGLNARRIIFYAAAVAAALLAMGAKEIAFTLPAILVLWEFSFYKGAVKKRLLYLLPFILAPVLIPLSLISSNSSLFTAEGETAPPAALDYLFTQFRVLVTYLRLLVFPVGQNLDYDYPLYHSFADLNVFLSFISLLLMVALGAFFFYRSRKKSSAAPLMLIAFGIFWFFIASSVESSVISIADVIFEHRIYLPSVGIIIAAVTGMVTASSALKHKVPLAERL